MGLQLQEAVETAASLSLFRIGYPLLLILSSLPGWSAEKPASSPLAMFYVNVTSVLLDSIFDTADHATAADILLSGLWIDTAPLSPTQRLLAGF